MSAPISLGFLYRRVVAAIRHGRLVPRLLTDGFDPATGKQVILRRNHHNNWEVRGDNPHDTSSTTLLTHIRRETSRSGDALATYHLLYAYDDWAPGEVGKPGLGTNAYTSRDDGATWTPVAGFDGLLDVLDLIVFNTSVSGDTDVTGTAYLYDGGDTLVWKTFGTDPILADQGSPGILGTDGYTYAIPLDSTANRIGGIIDDQRRSGGFEFYYSWTYHDDGIHIAEWKRQDSSPANQPILVAYRTAIPYAVATPLPWEGFKTYTYGPFGSGTGKERTSIFHRPAEGQALYRVNLNSHLISGTNFASVLAVAASITMNLDSWLRQIGPTALNYDLFSFNSTRRLVGFNLSNAFTAILQDTRGLIDGAEALWGGTPPVIDGLYGADPTTRFISEEYSLDPDDVEVILAILETNIGLGTLFLGPLPGEGSDPAYTAARLAAMLRHNDTTITYEDESTLLDFGDDRYTIHARTALAPATYGRAGSIYVSAGWGDGDTSDYRIMRWDNPGWFYVGPHPVSGAFREDNFGVAAQYSRWPLRFTRTRLWAWAIPEFLGQEDIPSVIVNSAFSDDGGQTWHYYWEGLYDIQPGVGDVAWASADNGQNIYKSIDGGLSWAMVHTGGPGGNVGGFPANKWGRLAPHPTDPDTVAVKSFLGVRVTTDGFATLGPVIGPGSTSSSTGPYPVYDAIGYVGNTVAARWDDTTLRYGDDPLSAWTVAGGQDPSGAENVGLLQRHGDTLYFLGEGFGDVGLLVSDDAHSWVRIFHSPDDNPYLAADGDATFSSGKAVGVLADGTILLALDGNLYRSPSPTDRGKSQFVSRAPGGAWVSAGDGFDLEIQGIDQSDNPAYVEFIVSRDGVATLGS